MLDIKPRQTSSDGSDPKELLSIDHPCHLKNRNAPKYIFMTKDIEDKIVLIPERYRYWGLRRNSE